jgi:hypothetical protein
MKASRVVTAGAALAACGVLGMAPAAAQASSAPDPAWTKQAPASHPSGRDVPAMAYDAATGTVVLFGGEGIHGLLHDTWTWNGTTWTKQHPATSPPARAAAAMAYDAATGTVVLFGGEGIHGGSLADTWTWDGTTWTKQDPATSPPRRAAAAMAYDAATGTVVLFGGISGSFTGFLHDTWTWDGTTWTKQAPASHPSARDAAAMAYDAATGTAVLFGGYRSRLPRSLDDTWTWDGTTWTKQHPATSPPRLRLAATAYDAATGTVVLFSGLALAPIHGPSNDTWTWDGTTWTEQHPATSPAPRFDAAMAYDAATRTAVLFGGNGIHAILDDTWTWG